MRNRVRVEECIHLAHNRVLWRTAVKTASLTKHSFSIKGAK
jgi:hypothetical protein